VRAIKDLRRGPRDRACLRAAALAVAGHPWQLGAAGYRRLVRGEKASEGCGMPYFCIQVETIPRRASRVLLDRRLDALGMPRAAVDWRVADQELRTVEAFAGRIDALLRANALGRLGQSTLPLPRDLDRLSALVAGGCHHIGTTRMAATPQDGVVDPDCRVFGIENLFIAGSAVFPTGGWSNPTLTLLALGYRLSDRLKAELATLPTIAPRRVRPAAITLR
jgi:choline dehydrogenase-like flavoprotein